MNLTLLADTCTPLRDSERAGELYRILLPYEPLYEHSAHATTYGAVARHLGDMAAVMHHFDGAVRHFNAALAMGRRLGARAWEARDAQIDYVRMRLTATIPVIANRRAPSSVPRSRPHRNSASRLARHGTGAQAARPGTPSGEWQRLSMLWPHR